ncbi:ABC transporter ATP-binding protein [Caldalkalibacillus mannanilyticus]|uniref:ABC transporter ATP-binding protein n=1 Tax=Caldalkalibacillus mannanilyticus TaxID=1418 RepID=UPI000A7E5E7E
MSDIINVSALTKEFAGDIQVVMALRHVNLEIAKGEFIAIMGSSGSGKSTLLNILSGLDRPTSGEILLDGLSLHNCTEQELTQVRRDKIGFIFQSFHLISVLTALENVSLPYY